MKKLIVIAVLLAAIVTGAFAQSGDITDDMFGLPGSNYMEPQWYVYSGFEKFYIQAGLGSDKADLGFAAKIGSLYIGVAYAGGLFNQYNWGYTESKINFAGKADQTIKQYTTPTGWATPTNTNPPENPGDPALYDRPVDHDFGILVGIADMGIRLNFKSDYQLFEVNENVAVGSTQYKSYKTEYGNMAPSIKWGMAKDLTDRGIRPSVQVSFGFHVDQSESERYAGKDSQGLYLRSADGTGGTDNYTDLGLALNLGGFTILSYDNGFSFSVDLDYSLTTTLYGKNSYTYDNLGTKVWTIEEQGRIKNATTTTIGVPTADIDTDIVTATHNIDPILQVLWDSEKIGVGARLHLPVEISSDESTSNEVDYDPTNRSYKLVNNGSEKVTSIEFSPRINLGGQYRLVPDKFNINMGAVIDLSSVKSETTETTKITGTGASKTTTTTTNVTNTTKSTGSTFTIGATLFLTKNVILDAYTGVKNATEFNFFGLSKTDSPNTGDIGSITYFGGILLALSF
jgi:hypothetical protein